jgi:hypothetical protein
VATVIDKMVSSNCHYIVNMAKPAVSRVFQLMFQLIGRPLEPLDSIVVFALLENISFALAVPATSNQQ